MNPDASELTRSPRAEASIASVEQMGNELTGVSGNGHFRFPNSHPGRVVFVVPDYPTTDYRVLPVKTPRPRQFLINESFLTIVAFRFDILTKVVQCNVGAFAPEQRLSHPRLHRARIAETSLQQIGMRWIEVPQHRQDSFVG